MSCGVMSYTVIDASMHDLLGWLIKSIQGDPAEFDAVSNDDPSDTPERRHFVVRVQTLHLDVKPIAADVLDKDGNWFQIILDKSLEPVSFEIITN